MRALKRISCSVHTEAVNRAQQQFLLLPVPLMCLAQQALRSRDQMDITVEITVFRI